ncbi:hypothetical protein [Micromonospora sp. BL4]|uniref:hypothetical protein n=1 Tax=Micromonospora sp. BL4 TaxID=2478710 RepID=UPI0011C3D0E6|nr:hypothetical protein [Micromonospora sp. BL4]
MTDVFGVRPRATSVDGVEMRVTRLVMVLLAGVLVSGCSGPEDPGAAESASVERVMEQVLERGDATRDEVVAHWDKVNAALAECMKAEGYEYLPYIDQAAVDRRVALGLSREQFVQRYGYGLTTLIDYLPQGTARVDPNREKLRAMPADQAGGWKRRLMVCQRDAERQFGPAPNIASLTLSAEESARSDKIYASVDADQRVVEALKTRAGCLREKGFDSADQRSLALSKAAERFRDGFERAVETAAGSGRDSSGLRLEDVFAAGELAELKRLQAREIAEARQTEPCQWPYDDLYKQVYKEYLDKALAGEL